MFSSKEDIYFLPKIYSSEENLYFLPQKIFSCEENIFPLFPLLSTIQ